MKKLWSNTLILGLMIPCLTFLFTSAPAPASDYVDDYGVRSMFGGFHLTEDHRGQVILHNSGRDCNVDITNDGPGEITIMVMDADDNPTYYELDAGRSTAVGVEKGGGVAVGLISGKSASGTYVIS